MTLTVNLFARARDLAGGPQLTVELETGATIADLKSALIATRPQLAPLIPSLLVAVDGEYATDADRLAPAAEVACFPPVSGG